MRTGRLVAGVLLLAASQCRGRGPESTASSAAPSAETPAGMPAATPSTAGAAEAAPERLVGRWLRSDSDYTIEIAAVSADGKLEARYLNPNPIHVSRAEAVAAHGALRVLVELQDKGYPGSYYTLTYDPGSDSLTGIYHHLGLKQDFDVAFSRISGPGR